MKKISSMISAVAAVSAVATAAVFTTMCVGVLHEPKMPQELKKVVK